MEFPLSKLTALEEKISSHRWVVPVLPDQELEVLLDAAIAFACEGNVFYILLLYNSERSL